MDTGGYKGIQSGENLPDLLGCPWSAGFARKYLFDWRTLDMQVFRSLYRSHRVLKAMPRCCIMLNIPDVAQETNYIYKPEECDVCEKVGWHGKCIKCGQIFGERVYPGGAPMLHVEIYKDMITRVVALLEVEHEDVCQEVIDYCKYQMAGCKDEAEATKYFESIIAVATKAIADDREYRKPKSLTG